jgi:hypothetical protein
MDVMAGRKSDDRRGAPRTAAALTRRDVLRALARRRNAELREIDRRQAERSRPTTAD